MMRVLRVRREVLDRVFSKRQLDGKIKRHSAEAMECRMRLDGRECLDPHHRLDLEGRALEAEARADYCREKQKHHDLEISVFLSVLRRG
jgi:hypothetical protein